MQTTLISSTTPPPFAVTRTVEPHAPEARPVDIAEVRPQNVVMSSRDLGWGPLNLERRELGPSAISFPAGATEHLILVSLAGGRLRCERGEERRTHTLSPGSIALQPSNSPVRWSWDTRLSFVLLALDPAFLLKVARTSFGLRAEEVELAATVCDNDPVIATIAGTLSRELVSGQRGSEVYAESLAHILAVHLLRRYNKRASDDDAVPMSVPSRPVARALRYMQERYADDIGLSDVATAARVSPYHLSRLFKQITGMTPHQHLIRLRVNSARALLTAGAGQRSLADVAEAVGFADQSHLTRHMKRVLGVTPGEVRG
jgi:AraC family transcriptional regulator